jgi:SAP domain-containing ribonucleoprotein
MYVTFYRQLFTYLPFSRNNILQDPEKLKARAARFGIQYVVEGQKRSAIAEDVDAEEAERRRKRAERFGLLPE